MPNEDYRDVHPSNLRLDPENPRLSRDSDWASESEELLQEDFLRRYNLVELACSIVDKGFTPRHAEALLVVEDPTESERYVVIERCPKCRRIR